MSAWDTGSALGPAIKRGDLICSLPAPARHHDVIREMAKAGIPTPIGGGADVQGFMTVLGFRDRPTTGRLIGYPEGKLLTSEDLW